VIRYARSLLAGSSERTYGHNPLGGWSVVAMLAALLLQAVTGLFANDDIFTEGPLARTVDKGTSDLLTAVHDINALILYGLIGLHVTVVLAYLLLKGENLIRPMITGWTVPRADLPPGTGPSVGWGRALLLLVLAAGAVSLIGG
jgi:cytochrome b